MRLPAAVSIREVGPRDGLQIEAPVPTERKVELLAALVATGVPRIEATAFVSPQATEHGRCGGGRGGARPVLRRQLVRTGRRAGRPGP